MHEERSDRQPRQEKKKYAAPKVERVPLRPEEAVLGACKTSGGFGPTYTCGVTCSISGS